MWGRLGVGSTAGASAVRDPHQHSRQQNLIFVVLCGRGCAVSPSRCAGRCHRAGDSAGGTSRTFSPSPAVPLPAPSPALVQMGAVLNEDRCRAEQVQDRCRAGVGQV